MGRGVFTTSTTATEDDVFRNQIQKWIQQNKDSIPKSVMDEYSAARSEGAANGFEDGQVALQDFVEYEMRSNPEFSNSIISNLPDSDYKVGGTISKSEAHGPTGLFSDVMFALGAAGGAAGFGLAGAGLLSSMGISTALGSIATSGSLSGAGGAGAAAGASNTGMAGFTAATGIPAPAAGALNAYGALTPAAGGIALPTGANLGMQAYNAAISGASGIAPEVGRKTLSSAVDKAANSTVMDITGNPSSGLGLLDGNISLNAAPGIGESSASLVDSIALGNGATVGSAVGPGVAGTFPAVSTAGGTTAGLTGTIEGLINTAATGNEFAIPGLLGEAYSNPVYDNMLNNMSPPTLEPYDKSKIPPKKPTDKSFLPDGLSLSDILTAGNVVGGIIDGGGQGQQPEEYQYSPFEQTPIKRNKFGLIFPEGGHYQQMANSLLGMQ